MTDLDLTEIRSRYEHAGQPLPDPCSRHVLLLVAEVERYRRLYEPVELPPVDAYENVVQALADERAEVVRLCDLLLERGNEREDLRALLAEILAHFPPSAPSTAAYSVRSEPVPPATLARWRSRLGGVS